RVLLASNREGRRWEALDLLARAEQLRRRQRLAGAALGERSVTLPTRADLRQQAVAALLLRDTPVHPEWARPPPYPLPDQRWAVLVRLESAEKATVWRVNLRNDEGLQFAQLDLGQDEEFPSVLAMSADGRFLAGHDDRPGMLLWEFPAGKKRRLPGPAPQGKQ